MKYIKFIIALIVNCQFWVVNSQTIHVLLTDEQGNPAACAGVKILNSTNDVDISAENGNLTITADIGDYLLISTYDLKQKVVQVTDTFLNIVISDNDRLTSVGKNFFIPEKETTAAVPIINGEKIMESSALNLANTLYGLAPGLAVLQNGGTEWNNDPAMYIRGLGGLSGNSEVLILVDGFERPLSSIVKEDVENIQVLKDAAATAIYGLRGANGVILVNTKKGIFNTTEIAVSYDHAFTSPVRLPKFVDAYTYALGMNEARRMDGATPVYNDYALERYRLGDRPLLYPNVDWVDEIFRNSGATNQYNVSIRG
ncbi:MAG: TonB-dependent receptor plug domain-containing protein, partial [Bacteroidales bacterium]|nr:TonB-dependent receptor plug domain-containing protein [Bacteroidales bacterium]